MFWNWNQQPHILKNLHSFLNLTWFENLLKKEEKKEPSPITRVLITRVFLYNAENVYYTKQNYSIHQEPKISDQFSRNRQSIVINPDMKQMVKLSKTSNGLLYPYSKRQSDYSRNKQRNCQKKTETLKKKNWNFENSKFNVLNKKKITGLPQQQNEDVKE